MNPLYCFLFCLGLGIVTRPLYMLTTHIAKKVNLIPVTVILDFSVTAAAGGGFIAFVILTGAVVAPYMFAAVFSGYMIAYYVTRKNKREK